MAASALIAIPTLGRPQQLDTALASVVPQAQRHDVRVLVVDDGPSEATRAAAERNGADYVAAGPAGGPNAARNLAFGSTDAELVILLDDDIRAPEGWLDAMLAAHQREPGDVSVLAGRIRPWLDPDHAPRSCGRHGSWVTELELGDEDRDARHGWSANMGVRRVWWELAGPFDDAHQVGGDEEEWVDRAARAGGRVRYIAAACVRHERVGRDASLVSLARAARARGRNLRRFEAAHGRAPSAAAELRTLAACLAHVVRRRCPMGLVLAAHSLGRLEHAIGQQPPPARPGVDDFLSGRSGHVAGRRGQLLRAADALLDVLGAPSALVQAVRARRLPRRRVLVVAIVRDPRDFDATIRPRLASRRHEVEVDAQPIDERGKFERLGAVLAGRDLSSYDHVLLVDDDVDLPRGFLDRFLAAVEQAGLVLAQPAHRRHSHAAWPVTRRRMPFGVRRTRFVEIGPVTLMRGPALEALVPFPSDLTMGWGLDVHWGAIARDAGWPIGVVDATPILHRLPVAGGYERAEVVAAARRFLAGRPYVTREEAAWSEPARGRRGGGA